MSECPDSVKEGLDGSKEGLDKLNGKVSILLIGGTRRVVEQFVELDHDFRDF